MFDPVYPCPPGGCPIHLLEIDTGARAITGRWAGSAGGDVYATPDGQYLVGRAAGPSLMAWNRLTRTPLPTLTRIGSSGWPHVLGQPSRLEV
jgi:hypothetical protein